MKLCPLPSGCTALQTDRPQPTLHAHHISHSTRHISIYATWRPPTLSLAILTTHRHLCQSTPHGRFRQPCRNLLTQHEQPCLAPETKGGAQGQTSPSQPVSWLPAGTNSMVELPLLCACQYRAGACAERSRDIRAKPACKIWSSSLANLSLV